MTTPTPLVVTPAGEWAKPQDLVRLPSGRVARLKEPDLLDMLSSDGETQQMFISLMATVENKPDGDDKPSTEAKAGAPTSLEDTFGMIGDLAPLLNKLVIASFVEPRVAEVANYEGGVIALSDLGLDDKMHVMMKAMATFQNLKPLIQASQGNLGAVSNQ